MKYTLTDVSACRRSLEVVVPPESIEKEFAEHVASLARRVAIDGFRKGKVPRHVVEKRFGKEIEQEVVEHLIRDSSIEALEQAGLRPLHMPIVKDYRFARAEGLTFRTEFEVRPSVTASGYKGLPVTRRAVEVTDTDVARALDELRERRARYEGVEGRGIEAGDFVLADIAATPEGSPDPPRFHEDAFFETGSAGPHPELTDEIRGLKPSEERSFGVKYPTDHPTAELAGKRVVYTVRLKEIRTKRLPGLDDDFAKEVGPFASLEDLRARVREDLRAMAVSREKTEARRQLIDQVVEAHGALDVPEAMVEDQIDGFLEDVARSMAAQGVDPRGAQVDWEEMRRDQIEPARKTVRGMLLLDAIAEQEKIEVAPAEVDAAIEREAGRRRQSAESLRGKIEKEGGLEALKRQILREKVLDFLLASANIQGRQGEP